MIDKRIDHSVELSSSNNTHWGMGMCVSTFLINISMILMNVVDIPYEIPPMFIIDILYALLLS